MPETEHRAERPTTPARRSPRRSAATLVAVLAIGLPPFLAACGGGAPVEEASAGGDRPVVGEETAAPPRDVLYPGEEATADDEPPSETPPSDSATPPPAEVRVFLVSIDAGESTPQAETFGCGDRLRAVAVPVATEGLDTAGRIAAALAELLDATAEGGLYTAFGDSELAVDQVTPVAGIEGLFRVRLTGQLRVGGVCDHPRVRAQLEATARQFDGVEEVEVTIGDQPLDALLTGR